MGRFGRWQRYALMLAFLGSDPALGGEAPSRWPALLVWAQALEVGLRIADPVPTHRWQVSLIDDPAAIEAHRQVTTADGDEVCTPLARRDAQPLLVTLARRHRVRLEGAVSLPAGLELARLPERAALEVCESFALVEPEGALPTYWQVYLIRVTPKRARAPLAVVIQTTWDPRAR